MLAEKPFPPTKSLEQILFAECVCMYNGVRCWKESTHTFSTNPQTNPTTKQHFTEPATVSAALSI